MLKRGLIASTIMYILLFSLAVQILTFGISISFRKEFSGIVYADSGIPVSGAMVYAFGSAGYGSAQTNPAGQYNITDGLLTGNYTVIVTKEGYLTPKADVTVTAGYETANLNLYLNRSGAISGRITDAISGLGVPNIFVSADSTSAAYGYYAMTDSAGNYSIDTNLGTGTYDMNIRLPKGHLETSKGPITVTAGAVTAGVDFALNRSGIISGRVTVTPSGEPLPDARITVISGSNSSFTSSAWTDATGYYNISTGLGTGNYTIMADYGTSYPAIVANVNVTAGVETPDLNFQLTVDPPPPSGIMTGRITDTNGQPLLGSAWVLAQDQTTNLYASPVHTDETGNYTISGLVTDNYTISVSLLGYLPANRTDVSVTINQTTPNVDLQLTRITSALSGRISGTVTGDENIIPEFQYPIGIVIVASVATLLTVSSSRNVKRLQEHQKRPLK